MPTETETAPPAPSIAPVQTTDAELLMLFVEHRDHAAFRRLAERHAGLVASVCRRVLWNEQDVEDACQATLMVLARRAGTIRRRVSIAGWLFRVARRTAIRAARLRVRSGEKPLQAEPTTTGDALERLQSRETCEILAAELERLPEHYRTPLILLYLEGKSIGAAAEELDCTHAALKGRVARARRLLRERLLRRGVALSVVLGVWLRGTDAAAAVVLTDQSIQCAIHYGATGRIGPGGSPNTVSLAKGATTMPTVTLTKSTLAVGITLLLGLAAFTAAGMGHAPNVGSGEPAIRTKAERPSDTAEIFPAVQLAQAETAADKADPVPTATAEATADKATIPPALDLKTRLPAEERILETLESPIAADLEFTDNTLPEVLEFIADAHDIKILVDKQALQDEGIKLHELRLSLVLSGVQLDSALNIILGPYDLDYVVEDEVLKITTESVVDSQWETRVYPVGHLIEAGFEEEELQKVVQTLAQPGGPTLPGPNATVDALNGNLVIHETIAGHRETRDLLEQLSRAASVEP